MPQDVRVLLIPGLWDSGPQHWQSFWEKDTAIFQRIRQRDWSTPHVDEWVATLDEAVSASTTPVVLAAHSLACCLVAHWASRKQSRLSPVKGALLVAPSDVEAPSYPSGTTGFTPMPLQTLPFPSIVVASTDDEYLSLERARYFAAHWGSRFEVAGPFGHINSASNLGDWPYGRALLDQLIGDV